MTSDPFKPTLGVVFAGGGTGGHLFPALAIAEQLHERDPGVRCEFLCSERPLDRQILSEEGVRFTPIPARAFGLRPLILANFLRGWAPSVRAARRSVRRLRDELREQGVDRLIVVAMGGFVSAPGARAAVLEKLPLVLVNLDATPGRANGWVARRAGTVFTAAEVKSRPTWRVVRPIVRSAAVADGDAAHCRRELGLDPAARTLLVTGASQGAKSINHLMMHLLETRPSRLMGWQVIHQCGPVVREGDRWTRDAIAQAYRQAGLPALVVPLIREMGRAWGAADLALSRCGAGSVAEAWANRVPTLFLPYPYHADQHQKWNAAPLERVGAAVLRTDHIEPQANAADAGETLLGLMDDPQRRQDMRARLRELGPADGAGVIAEAILSRSTGAPGAAGQS